MDPRSVRNISHMGFIIRSLHMGPRAFGNIWTLSTSSTAIFSAVRSVSSRLVIERRTGGDLIRYTKKQERYLSLEYKNSWKKLACICHLGDAPTGAPKSPFTNAPCDLLPNQWICCLLDLYGSYAVKDYKCSSNVPSPQAFKSTRILTCLSFSSIRGLKPSSAMRSILILLVIIFSGFMAPVRKAAITPS